jgi:hypothetical protein
MQVLELQVVPELQILMPDPRRHFVMVVQSSDALSTLRCTCFIRAALALVRSDMMELSPGDDFFEANPIISLSLCVYLFHHPLDCLRNR